MVSNQKAVIIFLIVFFLSVLFLAPGAAEAARVSTGDSLTIGAGETVDGDLYLFGETVTISGTVLGDAVVFANEAIIDGSVTGSLLVFAQTVRISGDVGGTIRGGANTISFQGTSGRDLVMGANTISITGSIGQDFFGAANSSTVTGSVGRNIQAAMDRLVIDAPVGGDISAVVNDLIFSSRAMVDGKVTYTSENEATVNNQAVIQGVIKRLDPPDKAVFVSPTRSAWSFIRPVLSLLAVALLLALLFPGLTGGTARTIKERPGLSIGSGALIVFVAPIAALILLITVIGIPISVLSMLLYIVLIYLTRVFAGYFLVLMALERFNKRLHPVWTTLIGVLVLALLIKIPYIGWLIHLAAVLFAAGAFILYLTGKKEEIVAVADPISE